MLRPGHASGEAGATLVEVLVAVLILALGMLSLSTMMAFAVQMPKLSGFRATAANLAASHVEKIRANRLGFETNAYATSSSYDGMFDDNIALQPCDYPNCTADSLASMDDAATKRAVRAALPAGGVLTRCDPNPCTDASLGNIWIIWQEPEARALLDPASSDNCPANYANPRPRCLYVRFKP